MENIERVHHPFEHTPALQFSYTYHHSFPATIAAYLGKFNFESIRHYTTITGVEQVNDDEIMMWRRQEQQGTSQLNWEKIIINRATKEMRTEHVQPIPQGYEIKEGDLFKPSEKK